MEKKALNKESIWQYDDTVFYVRALDPLTMIASSLVWDRSKKEYTVSTMQVVLTQLDEHMFLNLKEGKEDLYSIYRLIPSTGGLIVFSPNKANIKKHIKEGKLGATEEGDGFILKLTKEELDDYVRENLHEIFDDTRAGALISLKGFEEKE